MDEENKLRLGKLVISLGRDHGMTSTEIEEACASLEAHGLWSAHDNAAERAALLRWVAADQPPRRFARNPRREGYERDDAYVGTTDADMARSRWAGIDAEIHGYEEPRCYIVLGTHGFPLHGFGNREDAETFLRLNDDAAEIVEIPVT
jgi:hypothetical protein